MATDKTKNCTGYATASSLASAADWSDFFGLDPSLIRIATLILILFGGLSLWVYIILWLDRTEGSEAINRIKHYG